MLTHACSLRLSRLIIGLSLAALASAIAQPPSSTPAVPELQWFKGQSGYEKALELQQQTQADMFVVIYREDIPNEKGLYKWLDTRGLQEISVKKYLRSLIKVEIELNKKAHEELAKKEFGLQRTPSVYIRKPDGQCNRCTFFSYTDKRPKLLDPDDMIAEIQKQQAFVLRKKWMRPEGEEGGETGETTNAPAPQD